MLFRSPQFFTEKNLKLFTLYQSLCANVKKGRGFHRRDSEAAPGRVSGELDEAPDAQWYATGLRRKSTFSEYPREWIGSIHGKTPGIIQQG